MFFATAILSVLGVQVEGARRGARVENVGRAARMAGR